MWQLVDATLVTFSIDGHPVTDPIGFRGYLLEATVSIVAAPGKLLERLYKLADRLQLEPPRLIAEPLALAGASPGDGLIVEAGAQTTGLVLVRYGAPLAFGSVPHGGDDLLLALQDRFQLSQPRTEALKRAYIAGQLSADAAAAVRSVLQPAIETWLLALIDHLRSWDDVALTWSPEIYLCGGMGMLSDAQEAVSAARWLDALPFPHTPHVRVWDGSNMTQVLDHTELRWQADNIVTLAAAAWAARDRGGATPDGLLHRSLEIG
jgi:hypothetical protein